MTTSDERVTQTSDDDYGYGHATLPSPAELYQRWERQHWSVGALPVEEDRATWETLRPFSRRELLTTLAEVQVGEVVVTETLTPLVDHCPTPEGRLFLCTQLADEARHVRFFESYFEGAGAQPEGDDGTYPASYAKHFEPRLRAAMAAVRDDPDDVGAWFEASVFYHLVTEGILGVTALTTARRIVRTVTSLPVLGIGLTSVARDESRHVAFGLASGRTGVESGYGDRIWESYVSAIELAARVLVGPERKTPAPIFNAALRERARHLTAQWMTARRRIGRHLGVISLGARRAEAERRWDASCAHALDEYRERWGSEHPVRKAAALGLVGA